MLLESLVALAIFANVSVPVVPDPDYLQKLYPSQLQQQYGFNTLNQGPAATTTTTTTSEGSSAQPTDILSIISLAVTAGVGYFFQKNKTVMDRRTYMAADTTVKLAANDQASDVRTLNIVYAMTCMADIVGKYHKEDMETYQTRDGVSLWTYIEILNTSYNQDFQSRYVNIGPVNTTGSQSKDKVVATFNKVQQQITPSAPSPTPTNTPAAVSTVPLQGEGGRVQANKTANAATAKEEKDTSD